MSIGYRWLAAGSLAFFSQPACWANVPLDSFNSVNAALAPSIAIDRSPATNRRTGPAELLLEAARKEKERKPEGRKP